MDLGDAADFAIVLFLRYAMYTCTLNIYVNKTV